MNIKISNIPCNRDLVVIVKASDTLFCVGKENFRSSWINLKFFHLAEKDVYIDIYTESISLPSYCGSGHKRVVIRAGDHRRFYCA